MNLDHEFTLNPDGSGKVALHWTGPASAEPDAFVRSEISGARGVDAWSGISCSADSGELVFKATAYFPVLKDLRFHCQGFHFSGLEYEAARDKKGNFTLRGKSGDSKGAPAAPKLSGAALKKRIAEERGKIAPMRDFLAELFGALTCGATIHLPGKVARAKNAKKTGDRTVRQEFSGKTVIDLVDRILRDDAMAEKLVRFGSDGPEALQQLLGDQGPVEVDTAGKVADAFDYAAEVAAAREAFVPPAASEGQVPVGVKEAPPLKNVRVVAAKVVREADSDNEFTPQMQNRPGLSLTVAGELPGPALSLKEGRLDSALTDTGAQLAPEDEWQRTFHFPKLTKDRRVAYFDVELGAPPEGAAGMKEIRGTLRALVAEGEADVDLGFPSLEAGAAGAKAGAVLERVEDGGEGRVTLDVKLQVARETVLSLSLVKKDGTAVPLNQNGYSASSEECQLTYSADEGFDPSGRLVARMATGLQEYSVPFVLADVDFLGAGRGGAPAKAAEKPKQVKKKK